MQPHVPASVLLTQLLKELPQEHVSLAWLVGRLEQRSFGLLMLILGLLGLAPGIATFTGFLLAFPAAQMMLGRESATLPGFLATRSIPTRHFGRWTARTIPLFERTETLIRPRLQTPFQATKRAVGLVVLLLTATAIWPVPFSHIIPTLVIIVVAFAYLEEDGVLLCISLAAALVSLSISAAIVWATVRASGLIEGLRPNAWPALPRAARQQEFERAAVAPPISPSLRDDGLLSSDRLDV